MHVYMRYHVPIRKSMARNTMFSEARNAHSPILMYPTKKGWDGDILCPEFLERG